MIYRIKNKSIFQYKIYNHSYKKYLIKHPQTNLFQNTNTMGTKGISSHTNINTMGSKGISSHTNTNTKGSKGISSPTNKSVISISPGGYKGFYQLGIASYIKDNYNTNNYLFSGASAGAWVSLMMVYKGDHHIFINNLINWIHSYNHTNLNIIQQIIKEKILTNYQTSDFDLSRIFIGVVQMDTIYNFPSIKIHYNFTNLEEVIEACIASSHIPFVTGGLVKKYKNKISFDGGFSSYPYLNFNDTSIVLHIHPNLWKKNNNSFYIQNINLNINDYTTLFYIKNFNLSDLYNNGYNDSESNKDKLDKIFII
jgi:hypothetical protein